MLTAKQSRFVSEYLVDLNATQAAIRAGYSAKTAYSIGNENLNKPEIAAAIKAAQETHAEASGVTVRKLVDGMASIAFNPEAGARDRLKGMELLGKHLGMFTEKVQHEGEVVIKWAS